MTRQPYRSFVLSVGPWCLLTLTGCTASMKPVQAPGQTVLQRGRAAQVEREGVAVVVSPVVVPLAEEGDMTAVAVEIVNQSDRAVRLALNEVTLIGGDGMRRSPMDPRRFERYAKAATGDPPPFYRGPTRVYVGVGYGGWHYPCPPYYRGYDPFWNDYYWDDYDAVREYYYRRERMARFVSMLWKTRTVEPGYAAGGCVVFNYKLHRKELLGVEVTLDRVPATRPASHPTTRPLEPASDGPLRLRFHFRS